MFPWSKKKPVEKASPRPRRSLRRRSSIDQNQIQNQNHRSLIPRSLSANGKKNQPTFLSERVLSAGYLTLDQGNKGWTRYWFVLSGSSVSDVALRYYLHTESAREGASSAIGSMLLQGSSIVQIQEMIRINPGSLGGGRRGMVEEEWFLCADTQKEATKWSETIEMASRAPEQCSEAVGGWGMGGEAARLSYTVDRSSNNNDNRGSNNNNNSSGGSSSNSNESTNGQQSDRTSNTHRHRSSEGEAREIHRRRALELLHQRHDEFVMCFMQCNLDRLREMTSSGKYSKRRSGTRMEHCS